MGLDAWLRKASAKVSNLMIECALPPAVLRDSGFPHLPVTVTNPRPPSQALMDGSCAVFFFFFQLHLLGGHLLQFYNMSTARRIVCATQSLVSPVTGRLDLLEDGSSVHAGRTSVLFSAPFPTPGAVPGRWQEINKNVVRERLILVIENHEMNHRHTGSQS